MPGLSFTLAWPWGLLALASLPLIAWLHRHVVRAPRREVSALWLWADRERVALEGRVRSRVPDRWVLALELLAAALLALLLAGLDLRAQVQTTAHAGVIVDASASMAGGRPGERPIDAVRAGIAQLAREQPGLRVTLVLAAEQPALLGDRQLTPAAADALLARFEPRATTARLGPALDLIGALGVPSDALLIYSDDPALSHPRLARVGRATPNAGFVQASWLPGASPFVAVRNFSDRALALELAVDVDAGRARAVQKLKLPAFSEQPVALPVDASARRIEFALPDDALAIDNRAVLLAPLARQVGVSAAGAGEALQRAVTRATLAIPLLHPVPPERAALLVTENAEPPAARPSLSFTTKQPGTARLMLDPQPDPFAPQLADFDAHGLLWYAWEGAAPTDARVLLRSGDTPLVWQKSGQALHVLVDLARSNLLAHAAFPLLLDRLARAIDAELGGLPRSNFRAGERVRFAPRADSRGETQVRAPSGAVSRFAPGAAIDLGVVSEPGVYALDTGGAHAELAVQFASADESDLSRRGAATPPPRLVFAAQRARDAPPRLRTPLLLALLAALGLAFSLLDRRGRAA